MEFSIRVRSSGDLAGCVDALAAAHASCGYPTNWPQDPTAWLTPSRFIRAWIVTDADGRVVGHVAVRHCHDSADPMADRGAAELVRLFVAPEAQGRGAATVLLRTVDEWAAAHRVALVLEVNDSLGSAIALYERLGWRRAETARAEWTTPQGEPVTIHRYVRG